MERPVKLSVLLPSHRSGLTAISRIAQVCSWAGPNIEVIVRDNSGNAEKRDLISRFRSEHCKVICVDPCEPLENFFSLLEMAKGEFIFSAADDDFSFDRGIRSMSEFLDQTVADPSVVGIIGHYVLESSSGSSIASYDGCDSDDPVTRVAGYLTNGGPNVFCYSALRRDMLAHTYAFLTAMPFYLSFHDQIQALLFLLQGKFLKIDRLLYCYDVGAWEASKTAEGRDIAFYQAAGLDPAINLIHWLLCAFEGAVLARNATLFPDYPLAQRQAIADRWFATRFVSFVRNARSAHGSGYEDESRRIRQRLLASTGQLSFQSLLAEICNLIALFSTEKADRYHAFWDAQINQRIAGHSKLTRPAASTAA